MSHVVRRVLDIWGLPEADGTGHERNPQVTVAIVWSALKRDYTVEAVRHELTRYLLSQGERESNQGMATPEEMFLINCCFELSSSIPELAFDASTTKTMIWTFPPVGYAPTLRRLVTLHFDQAQLLHALAEGIRNAKTDFSRGCCVHGLQTYFWEVAQSADTQICRPLQDFEAALRSIVLAEDALFR